MNEKKFWMVWNPDMRAPVVKRFEFFEACLEAARLASLHPSQTFIVLEAVFAYTSQITTSAHKLTM